MHPELIYRYISFYTQSQIIVRDYGINITNTDIVISNILVRNKNWISSDFAKLCLEFETLYLFKRLGNNLCSVKFTQVWFCKSWVSNISLMKSVCRYTIFFKRTKNI